MEQSWLRRHTTTDITERKKTEKEMEETSEKLRQLTAHLLNIREEGENASGVMTR